MKEYVIGGCRFVRVIFVEKFVARMLGVSEIGQFPAQAFYLFVSEDSNASHVSVFMKKVDLIFGETKTAGISLYLRAEHRPDWIMKGRKVLHEASVSLEIRAFTEGRYSSWNVAELLSECGDVTQRCGSDDVLGWSGCDGASAWPAAAIGAICGVLTSDENFELTLDCGNIGGAAGGTPRAPTSAQCQSTVGPKSWSRLPRNAIAPSGRSVALR